MNLKNIVVKLAAEVIAETKVQIPLTATKVYFRKWKSAPWEIEALFPDLDINGSHCRSYKNGKHTHENFNFTMGMTRKAKPDEYSALLTELISLGYNLEVIK